MAEPFANPVAQPLAQPIHATTVARHGPDGWRGVLLTGPSGAGKSDLALRLVGAGWRLVADDYSEVWASGGVAWATAPPRIAGLIEARGLGLVPCPPRRIVRAILIVVCGHVAVERAPEPRYQTVAGLRLPCLSIDIRPASAGQTVTLALGRACAAARS